jgi:hypothetical protein
LRGEQGDVVVAEGAGGRVGVRGAVVLIAAALVAGGCALVPATITPAVGAPPAEKPCAAAAVRSCALPFPSDEFALDDPTAVTGLRLDVPETLVPERIINQLGPGARPADASRGADGYSALTPVTFELPRAVDPASLPRDGGDVFAVFDAVTGERVPIRVELPAEAGRHGAPESVVVAWPRLRYGHGRTYVARITTGLRPRDGVAFTKPAGLAGDSPTAKELRSTLERIEGNRWNEVVSATRFTVRSLENSTVEIDRMAAIARSEDHPLRNLRVDLPVLVQNASAVVSGEVRISDFRDADGVARASNGSTARWVKFLLVLPERPAGPEGAPIAIYGHGLTVAKETMLLTASANAHMGVATIGIDVPNHGDRQAGFDAGYLLDLTTPRKMGRLASMPVQGVVDHVSLLMAVRDHVGDLELRLPDLPWRTGAAAPKVDTSRILYQGTSMGGVLGAGFAALAPELMGAFLQVAGTGTADVIYHSIIWPLFMRLVPEGASTGDAYALMGAATMLLDVADNVNLLDRLRSDDTPVFLAYGVGDGVVLNEASDRMVGLLGLPLVGRQISRLHSEPPLTGSDEPPADGWGVAQIWANAPVELQSFAAHVAFAEPRSARLLEQWTRDRLVASGLDVPAAR